MKTIKNVQNNIFEAETGSIFQRFSALISVGVWCYTFSQEDKRTARR